MIITWKVNFINLLEMKEFILYIIHRFNHLQLKPLASSEVWFRVKFQFGE